MLLALIDGLEDLRKTHPYGPVNLYTREDSRLMIGGELTSAILFAYRLAEKQTEDREDTAAQFREVLARCSLRVDDDGEPVLTLPNVMVAS